MPFEPQPKAAGDLIRSLDWNDAMTEIVRLEQDKLNITGGNVSGQLTIDSGFAVGEMNPALRILHNGSFNWGNALSIDQNVIGNSDGPKIRFQKTMAASKSWSAGIINGADAGQFVISEDTDAAFGAARLAIAPGGKVGIDTTTPNEAFQIGDRWTFHNGGSKYIGYNSFFNGSQDVRIVAGAASQLRFNADGSLVIRNISDGAAGATATGNDILFRNGGVEAIRMEASNFSLGESTNFFKGDVGLIIFPPPPASQNIVNFSFGRSASIGNYVFRFGHIIPGANFFNDRFSTRLSIDQAGNVRAAGAFIPNGADYSEFFESENGREIPVGTAVAVGSEGLIRPAKKADTPIGIVTKTPGILGNNPAEWPQKYERDEYGTLVMETYEAEVPLSESAAAELNAILKEGGELSTKDKKRLIQKVKGQRPKLNSGYDPEKPYVERTERPEWQMVGLLGQLHLTKGQPVAPSWVKLREVSEKVELWLVK